RRPLHFAEGNKTHLIGLAHLLKRPAYAHVARLPCTTVRRLPEGCNGGDHGFSPDYGLHNSRTIERSRRRQRRPERIELVPARLGCAPYAEWQRLRSRNLLQPVKRLERLARRHFIGMHCCERLAEAVRFRWGCRFRRLALCGNGKQWQIVNQPVRLAGDLAGFKLVRSEEHTS